MVRKSQGFPSIHTEDSKPSQPRLKDMSITLTVKGTVEGMEEATING